MADRMSETHIYDLYLLCDIDLPWEDDPLREHPASRKELFDLYFQTLNRWKVPFEVISGKAANDCLTQFQRRPGVKNNSMHG